MIKWKTAVAIYIYIYDIYIKCYCVYVLVLRSCCIKLGQYLNRYFSINWTVQVQIYNSPGYFKIHQILVRVCIRAWSGVQNRQRLKQNEAVRFKNLDFLFSRKFGKQQNSSGVLISLHGIHGVHGVHCVHGVEGVEVGLHHGGGQRLVIDLLVVSGEGHGGTCSGSWEKKCKHINISMKTGQRSPRDSLKWNKITDALHQLTPQRFRLTQIDTEDFLSQMDVFFFICFIYKIGWMYLRTLGTM